MGGEVTLRFEPTVLTDEEEELRREVRAFLDEELPMKSRLALGQAGGRDHAFSRKLGERGWIGITIPTRYGGAGGTSVQRYVVTEELLAAQAPVSSHWVADRQTAPSILHSGTEEQRMRFLPAIARGECFFAIGMSEPDAGSDLAAVRTRATRVEGGWSVTGTKVWTTGAHESHYFAVLCRTSDEGETRHAGLSQLIVDLHGDGVTVNQIATLDGDHDFCEVVLNEVFVADDLVLGEIGDGWRQVTSELSYERYGPERWLSTWGVYTACLAAVGPAASEHVQAAIGNLAARFRVIRQLSLAVARAIDNGARPAQEAAAVKDVGTSFEQQVVETVRLLLSVELDPSADERLHRVLSAAVVTAPMFTLRGGTTEILRSILARGLRA
jgi:alkylation response protein AidB-like acyl-CoA dehydrogenase